VQSGKRLNEGDYITPGIRTGIKITSFYNENKVNSPISSAFTSSGSTSSSTSSIASIGINNHGGDAHSPTKRIGSTEDNPNFLEDFYSQSRLHFIGKAELYRYRNALFVHAQ
jgi:hypothetical protein